MIESLIDVEVAYALPDEQYLFEVKVVNGATVEQAIKASPLLNAQPNLNLSKVGIFGRPVDASTVLREGDRVEVYRPLKADPRERRRKQVADERLEGI
jgi:putative ubiquitin-RnfH superfamily antitoxin RatB of RatAB toxin-antitoxin module